MTKTKRKPQTWVSSTPLLAAVEYEIRVAEKQIELLQLRIKEDPAIRGNVAPFGSNLWRMVKRLKKAIAEATNTERSHGAENPKL
jgi:hypothetical protein